MNILYNVPAAMGKKYIVKVDDNFHFGDESESYFKGSFDSLAEAIKKCEEITISSLREHYEEGITADKLKAQWCMFGDDPFIIGPEGGVLFSAREYADTKLCEKIIEECLKDKELDQEK